MKRRQDACAGCPLLDDIDRLLIVPPPLDVMIMIKGFLRAGKQLNTTHIAAVLEKPTKGKPSHIETVVQGLPGRCCGYGKANHGVQVIAAMEAAEDYVEFWRSDGAVMPQNVKRAEEGVTDETSAFVGGAADADA